MADKNDEARDTTSGSEPEESGKTPGTEAEEFFKAGVFLMNRERLKEAYQAFRKAFEMKGGDPRYMSYYGYMLAKVGGRLKEGLVLCERAASREFYRSELYYNLAQVYMLVGNRKKAYETLRKGMTLDKTNKNIVRELEKMGIRKPPVFPFLDRKNAINKMAGKLLYRLRLRR